MALKKISCKGLKGEWFGFEVYEVGRGELLATIGAYDKEETAKLELERFADKNQNQSLKPFEVLKILCRNGRRYEVLNFNLDDCPSCRSEENEVINPPIENCNETVHKFPIPSTEFEILDYVEETKEVRIIAAYDSDGVSYLYGNVNASIVFVGKKEGFRNKIFIETYLPTTLTIVVRKIEC